MQTPNTRGRPPFGGYSCLLQFTSYVLYACGINIFGFYSGLNELIVRSYQRAISYGQLSISNQNFLKCAMSQESSVVISAKIKVQTQTSNDGWAEFAHANGMTANSSELVIRILCELFELFE